MNATDQILGVFTKRGAGAYFGESVSMLEHALQAAHFAQRAAAAPSLVVAALLHDVGHLVEEVPDDLADWVEDARHEEVGARWLTARFPRIGIRTCAAARPREALFMRDEHSLFLEIERRLGSHPQAAGRPDDRVRDRAIRVRAVLQGRGQSSVLG